MNLFSNIRRLNERPPKLTGEYQIREMYPQDFSAVIELLMEFREHPRLQGLPPFKNPERVLKQVLNYGVSRIYEHRVHGVCGMALGVTTPNMWNPDHNVLAEIAYYMRPSARSWKGGYLLLKSYLAACDDLKASGKIHHYLMVSLDIDFDYSKFGLSPLENLWRG